MPAPATAYTLSASASATLDASGNGRVELGPRNGPASWLVESVIVTTSRPGDPPVPSLSLYLDQETPSGLKGVTYDGSKDETSLGIEMNRGQVLIAVWEGGQAGDTASLTVHGKKW